MIWQACAASPAAPHARAHTLTQRIDWGGQVWAHVVEALIKGGAEIEKRSKLGATALIIAAESGKIEVVEALLRVSSAHAPHASRSAWRSARPWLPALDLTRQRVRMGTGWRRHRGSGQAWEHCPEEGSGGRHGHFDR